MNIDFYHILLLFHLGAMCTAVCLVFLADKDAFKWVLGKKQTLDAGSIKRLHAFTWIALIALIGSGTLLLLQNNLFLLKEPLFIIKLLFVGMLVVNGVLIGRLIPLALTRPFASLTFKEKLPLLMSGALSGVSWLSILAIAYALFWPWIR